MDEDILVFYGRRPPVYAVYRIEKRVMVHFADSKKDADDQRKKVAKLNPLRGEINGLIDGWRMAKEGSNSRCRAERYDRRVGDALVVAFEGDPETAEFLLKAIKQDILAERISKGRVEYLLAALLTGFGGLLFILFATAWIYYPPQGVALWLAAAAGAFGAFFSIALGLRGRTVLPDLERTANIMDAVLRMAIGLIAAAALMALMRAGIVNIDLGASSVPNEATAARPEWLIILIVGFIAGFSERFVPDLLAQATSSTDAAQTQPGQSVAAATQPAAPPPAQPAVEEAVLQEVPEEDPLPEEAASDACVSDLELPDDMVTADPALPAAAGGVERPAQPGGGT
ncbi:MAG TPA: hypothetical protein VES64_02210 [Allosphingosinicella sp.]|nr:hypothetical protein [Allosphingosinicella sp.]